MPLEGRQVVGGEALDAVARRHVAEARAPEGQRVDQRLAQDDLLARLERRDVEDAAVRAGQVEVQRRPRPQLVLGVIFRP